MIRYKIKNNPPDYWESITSCEFIERINNNELEVIEIKETPYNSEIICALVPKKKEKDEYIIVTVKSGSYNSYCDEKTEYYVAQRSECEKENLDENLPIIGLHFYDKIEAKKVCDYLNNELDKRVDEKLNKMFHCGRIELPFDFLKEWDNKNETKIKERIRDKLCLTSKTHIGCFFKADLLVLSKVDYTIIHEWDLCDALEIPFSTKIGANTFCCDDMILNVAKVREYID